MSWLSKNKNRSGKEKQLEGIVAQNFLENPWDWRKNSEILGLPLTFPQWFWQFFRLHIRFPWSRVGAISSAPRWTSETSLDRSNLNLRSNSQLTGNEGNDFLHHMLLDKFGVHKRFSTLWNRKNNLYKHAEDLKKKRPLFFPVAPVVWDTSRFIFRFSSVFYSKISWLRGPKKLPPPFPGQTKWKKSPWIFLQVLFVRPVGPGHRPRIGYRKQGLHISTS